MAWAAPEAMDIDDSLIAVIDGGEGSPVRRWFQRMEENQPISGVWHEFLPEEQAVLQELGIRAVLIVPIHLNGVWRGALGFMEMRFERQWTPSEVASLHTAAQLLAAAWQRHEHQKALEEHQRILSILREVLETLNASPHVQDALPTIAKHLKALTGCDRVSVALLEEGNRWFRIVALDQPRPELSRGTRLPVHATSAAQDILAGRLHLSPDLAQELTHEGERLLYRAGHRSRVNLPLQVGDRVLGALNLTWPYPEGYRREHFPLLQAVARALALAIERTRYVESLAQRQREAEILRQAAAFLTAELDPRIVVERLLDHLSVIIPYDSATVFLHRGDHLQAVAMRGLPTVHRAQRFNVDNPLFQEIAQTGKPLRLDDASQDPRFENWNVPYTIRGWMGAPLRARGRVIGFLTVDNRQPGAYTEHHASLLSIFADHAAAALENARLYQEALVANKELQETLDERAELLHRVSHELRTPLTLILGLLELLIQKEDIRHASPDVKETVTKLLAEARHVRHMVHQVLMHKRIQHTQLQLTSLSLAEWLENVASVWDPLLRREDKRLRLKIQRPLAVVRADPNYLRQVIDNLLDNANKYSPPGTAITIRAWTQDGEVRVAVQDEGIGVPPAKIPALFEPFYRLERKVEYQKKGLGLGLALCREIVERHGGRIWAESDGEGTGLTVTFALPATEETSPPER